jgi:hypothetical protein
VTVAITTCVHGTRNWTGQRVMPLMADEESQILKFIVKFWFS